VAAGDTRCSWPTLHRCSLPATPRGRNVRRDIEDEAVETYTIREAAERCRVSYEALRRRVDRGSIQTTRKDGVRRIPRGELERVGLWPGATSGAPEEVQRLQTELERVRGELRELRLLPRKVDAERRTRELIENTLHQERASRQSLELQLRDIEQAHVEASGKLEELSQAGFFARRRLLRELRQA
jgi:predicted RNase H-like nuclease (RuvC/YqgF family)